MTPHSVTFASSSFWPIAIGFFGLGTGTPLHGVKRRAGRMDGHRFLFVSVLGAYVFGHAGDVPVMIVFVGLTLIYLIEVPTRLAGWNAGL